MPPYKGRGPLRGEKIAPMGQPRIIGFKKRGGVTTRRCAIKSGIFVFCSSGIFYFRSASFHGELIMGFGRSDAVNSPDGL